MPSALEQALQRLDPGAKKAPDDFLTDWGNRLWQYAKPALQQILTDPNINAGHPLNAVRPGSDVAASPFEAFGNAWVGRDPHASALDRRIGGHMGGMIMPAPGRAEEEAAGAMADAERVIARKVVPRARMWSIGNRATQGAEHQVEDVPIHALKRYEHPGFGDTYEYDNSLQRSMEDIKQNGFPQPVVILAGTRSRNAVLEDGHAMNIEAAHRLGYTHVPAIVEVSPWAGRHMGGSTHVEQDIIPTHTPGPHQIELDEAPGMHYGLPSYAWRKPSEVFKSYQPGAHSDPELAWAAREALQGSQRGYHGTTRQFARFRHPVTNTDYHKALDQLAATHGSLNPETAGNFVSGGYGRQGTIWPIDIPPNEQLYDLEQPLHPTRRFNVDPTVDPRGAGERLSGFDTSHMNSLIMERGFRRRPDLLARAIQNMNLWGLNEEEAEKKATELAEGYAVQFRDSQQPRTLFQHLREGGEADDLYSYLADHEKRDLIRELHGSMRQEGFRGFNYINTNPPETRGAPDMSSFGIFDPQDIKSPFHKENAWANLIMPQISEEEWRRLLGLTD